MDYKKTGKIQECKFRSVKNPQQTMFIPKSAITPQGVYHTLLNSLLASEPISTDSDCRLTCENEQWYLIVGVKIEAPTISDNQARVVAVDPGIRTFASFYSVDSCGKIGLQNFGRILSLGRHLDSLISRRTKCDNKRSRHNMRKAEKRLRWKIKNLIDEIHHKTVKFLLDNFDVIIIPPFETSQMSVKTKRKINAKSVRAMMTFAHYRFQEFLKFKAKTRGKVVLNQNEAYTSKTVSWTGEIKTIGGAKYIKSGGLVVDRDYNGSRGIFLRGLCEISPALEQ
jgi:putative transposase